MPKHLAAILSVFGLATTTTPHMEAQILKGDQAAKKAPTQKATNEVAKPAPAASSQQKLVLKQQTVRNATGATQKNTTETCNQNNNTGTCAAITKGNQQNMQGNQALTKGNQQLTKGNQQLTKGNQQLTKGNQQLTKGNQQLTKGNQQLTKGNQALTPPPPQH